MEDWKIGRKNVETLGKSSPIRMTHNSTPRGVVETWLFYQKVKSNISGGPLTFCENGSLGW